MQNIRKITQRGPGSWAVILPPSIMKSLGWRKNQRVVVKRTARGVLITDAATKHRKKK